MLTLKNLRKTYQVGDTTTHALDGVSINFRPQEFVAILGPSGSGKTTLLNVVGGLDTYDQGDMVINGQSTKDFQDQDWDAYRNNTIGFIFQSYNLISHLTILNNVELGMTLSGLDNETKRQKALDALDRVGLANQVHKQPSQLSGGQMQRVAIARALANDPDILLCDEPTGALDSKTGQQIMQLIQEVAQEKLVIMVTHDQDLAENYANRIVHFKDGEIMADSNPYQDEDQANTLQLKRTKMSYWTALKLSFNNIKAKKGRTFLTAFASSIGIISIAVVLSLSNGFQQEIEDTQAETTAQFPITISQVASDPSNIDRDQADLPDYPDTNQVTAVADRAQAAQHENDINQDFVDYVKKIDPALAPYINFNTATNLQLMREIAGDIQPVTLSNFDQDSATGQVEQFYAANAGLGSSTFPDYVGNGDQNFLASNYDLLAGQLPTQATDLVLVVDDHNQTNLNALKNLGFDIKDGQNLDMDQIIGTKVRWIANDNYFEKVPSGQFVPKANTQAVYQADGNQDLTITGVVRAKPDATMAILSPGIAYANDLTRQVIDINQDSEIVQAQQDSDRNILTGQKLTGDQKSQILTSLGAAGQPTSIMVYPSNFESKDQVLAYLDQYNEGKDEADQILYTDLAGTMTELTGGLMDAITYVLVAFAGISLVTSMIMIAIITYTSVLERTKEIGVLKALGARKKDITRVFDSETLILGVLSGLIGIGVAYAATVPINLVIENLTGLVGVAKLNPWHALALLITATVLTVLGGHIPARMAANKDAAEALRAD
ncbi:sulfate ABC transporter ATP-binding protein [Aerococcus urinaehominis]|uniref:Sulfate ABC transporter ATP-binding protein n=1 Tax=Aerococcus urinaehominis TaxID=128944 RepID=A0A0X8FM40_9LACT|nr:ABC transporter ATP-binding protein/permease [Aerococcus urinaehominis]AMB99842.1 sulfate ABC transporter ATP-binding protein [Aerococcus urinaehominis]SDM62672.1 putative ABC transport system permease protein [Aerococcus urinaehominis]